MQICDRKLDWKNQPLAVRPAALTLVVVHSAQCNATLEQVHSAAQQKGWLGVGYHYWIDADGTVKTARAHLALGAHCLGYNAGSIGIALFGDCRAAAPSAEQMDALAALCTKLYQDGPGGPEPVRWTLHRDVCDTDCPGEKFPEGDFSARMAKAGMPRFKPAARKPVACAFDKHE